MLKNNNFGIIKKLSRRTLGANRTRNIFAILAIVLTTFMFTTVFTIGFNMAKNMSTMLLREQGGKATIFLNNPKEEQIAQIKKMKYLNAAGLRISVGKTLPRTEDGNSVQVDYYDKTEYEENYLPAIGDVEGKYPVEEQEIMLSISALEELGIKKPKLGMDIALIFKDGGEEQFQLSGWFRTYHTFSEGNCEGLVSEEYINKRKLTGDKNGILSISAKTGCQGKLLDLLENKVRLSGTQEFLSSYDRQDETKGNNMTIIVCFGSIALIIILGGYLLIYNVMYISVTKDIRFYGMLKTVGTSPKQIRTIVRKQVFTLSVWGIPLGLIFGTVVSFVAVPLSLKLFDDTRQILPMEVHFSLPIYLLTILFALVTVAVSSHKPAKLAGKISPVEALKFNGVKKESGKKKEGRGSTDGGKLYKMAYRNVFREKRRAMVVFASLFMGTMVFLSVNTFLDGLKLERYAEFYLPNDIVIYTTSGEYGDSEKLREEYQNSAKKLADEIGKIEGIEIVSINRSADMWLAFDEELFHSFYFSESDSGMTKEEWIDFYKENPTEYASPVVAVNSALIKAYNRKAKNKIDIERFEKGEICLVGFARSEEQANALKGKKLTLTQQGKENSTEIEIGLCATREDGEYLNNIGYYWMFQGGMDIILVSENIVNNLTDNPAVETIVADYKQEQESYVISQVKKLTENNSSVVQVEIKPEIMENFRSSMTAMRILGSIISGILILIGVLNFINVMLTGVFIRKKEFAVLESVGMTKKQIRKMLILEGAYYGGLTIGLIFTVGSVMVYGVAKMTQAIADYAVFVYPYQTIIVILVVILMICMLVPAVVYKMLARESVTERLRMEG